MNQLTQLPQKLVPQFVRQKLKDRIELQKIISNTGWLIGDKVIQIIINLFVGVWVSRYLGPDQRGIYLYANSFVTLLVPFSALGIGAILVRELVREPESKGELMGSGFGIQVASYLLLLPLMIMAVILLRTGETLVIWSVIIIACGNLFATGRIFNFWFQSILQSKYVVLATRIVEFVIAALRVFLLLINASLLAFVAIAALELFLLFAAKLYFYIRTGESIRIWRFNLSRAKELLRDGWPLTFSFLAVTVYLQIDSVMLGQLLDDHAVGIFGEAGRISSMWYLLPNAVAVSVYPALVRARGSLSPKQYHRRVQQFLDIMVLIGFAFAIPAAIFAPMLISKLYGSEFAASGSVLTILATTFIFVSLRQGMDRWLMVENRTRVTMWSIFLGIILNIVLNFWMIPLFGVYGTAWSTVIAIAISVYLPCLLIPNLRPLFKQLVLALFAPFRIHTLILGRK